MSVAAREDAVGTREKVLIEREDALTEREAAFEKREDNLERIVAKKDAKLEQKRKQLEQEQEEFWDQIEEWREWYLEQLMAINPDRGPADDNADLRDLQEELQEEFQGWEDRLEEQRRVQEKKETLINSIQELASINNKYYKRVQASLVVNGRHTKPKSLFDIVSDVDEKRKEKISDMKRNLYGKFSDTYYENNQEDREFQ